jgi:uncharacterized protein (DUF305 family)
MSVSRAIGIAFVAAVVAACGRDTAKSGMQMPDVVVPTGVDYTAADVRFMQGMIHHHTQALAMAAMATTHGASDKVKLLCKKINISQTDEINTMKTWLESRHQTVPDPNDAHPMMMPGMLSAEQMQQLDAARDTTFDRLFLTFMIQHHEGALKMVADLRATPGAAQASEMFRYTSDVDNDQRGEISVMRQMLASSTQRSAAQ